MCFPLPLTPFENYLLADDHPQAPMCFYLRLELMGRVDRPRLERALSRVVARQPLLRAVVGQHEGAAAWVASHRTPEIVWYRSVDDQQAPALPALDIRRESGLRLAVSLNGNRSIVWLQLHHVTVDGIGAMQLVEELLVAYEAAGAANSQRPDLVPLDPHLLHERGGDRLSGWRRLTKAAASLLASVGIWQYLTNRVQPLVAQPPLEPAAPAGPRFVAHRFSAQELRELKWTARRQGRTVNDVLIGELMTTLEAWNARRAGRQRLGKIRLAVPVNLRTAADERLPACNQVAMVFIDRSSAAIGRPQSLARGVALDMWFVKRFGLARVFLWSLAWLQWLPGGLSRTLTSSGSLATAVLSNLGVVLDDAPLLRRTGRLAAGELTLEKINFLPPIRPQTSLACGVATYAGQLGLSLQFDPTVLSHEAAQALLADLVARVRPLAVGRCGVPRQSGSPVVRPSRRRSVANPRPALTPSGLEPAARPGVTARSGEQVLTDDDELLTGSHLEPVAA